MSFYERTANAGHREQLSKPPVGGIGELVQKNRFQDMNEADFLAKCRGEGGNPQNRRARIVHRLCAIPGLSRAILMAASFYVRLREGGSEMLAFKEA